MNSNSFRPTVFVIDDDAAVRDSIRLLLRTVNVDAETYGSGAAFLDAYCEDRPGCLLLDRSMPAMSGVEVQSRLSERRSILPIIFMAACSDMQATVTAIQGGAVRLIEKPFRDQILIDAVHHAFDIDCANRQALRDPRDIARRLTTLTPRERVVLDLILRDHSDEVIAHEAGISQHALDRCRARVMEKMCASSLVHLARIMLRAEG